MIEIKCIIDSCNNVRRVKTIEKRNSGLCKSCARKLPRKTTYIRHFRMCIDCGQVDQVGSKKLTINKRCEDCYKKQRAENRIEYERVCVDCGDVRPVSNKSAAASERCRPCNEANILGRAKKPNRAKPGTAKPRTKKKTISKAFIEKQRKINKEHREEVEKAAEATAIPKQRKTDAEMMAEFLAKNEVTVLPNKYEE